MSFEGSCFSILFWNSDIALDIQGLPLLVHILFLNDPSLRLLQLSPVKQFPFLCHQAWSLSQATHAPNTTKLIISLTKPLFSGVYQPLRHSYQKPGIFFEFSSLDPHVQPIIYSCEFFLKTSYNPIFF